MSRSSDTNDSEHEIHRVAVIRKGEETLQILPSLCTKTKLIILCQPSEVCNLTDHPVLDVSCIQMQHQNQILFSDTRTASKSTASRCGTEMGRASDGTTRPALSRPSSSARPRRSSSWSGGRRKTTFSHCSGTGLGKLLLKVT